ncbi:transporter substrate-binding domain-containing protein [Halopseudomonas pachastrellae]|nr:transporter substrate-binding domain-containing protein [Halopseudomonas pachastrellae]
MLLADGSVRGISIDTHTTVLERLGCKTVLRKLPWARALRELETGRLDILHGAFRRPEREVYAHFSGQILPRRATCCLPTRTPSPAGRPIASPTLQARRFAWARRLTCNTAPTTGC